jgi:hypothetical protein
MIKTMQLMISKDTARKRIDNKTTFLVVLLISLMFLLSCEDITEKDISNEELVLLAPGENLRTSIATQTFWWEELDGASSYNLQVVSPSFEYVEVLLADTVLTENQFTINLFPGRFEWRVKAQNGYYTTPFVMRSLQIDSTMDLKSQKVRWQKLYNADLYSIEVHEISWSGALAYNLLSISYDTLSIRDLKDGVYYWGIKAWNLNSATDFSTRKIIIDKVAPGTPSLLSPLNKANLLNLPVNLTWNRISDSGSSLSDSLIVSTDSLFTSGKIIIATSLADTRYDNAVQDTGTYFWKVKTVDAAHNQSQFTPMRRFKVLNN